MANINENTVKGYDQLIASNERSFIGDKNATLKILIIGNSITRHGPKPEIGWPYDWGMAASCEANDYVHRFVSKLNENNIDAYVMVRQGWWWERHFLDEDVLDHFDKEREFDADIVIFRLGENVPKENRERCYEKLKVFAPFICPNGKIVFTTCFWEAGATDEAIRKVAKERNEICIDECFSKDERNMALGKFEHRGVSIHPSDKGMETIANAIFNAVKTLIK